MPRFSAPKLAAHVACAVPWAWLVLDAVTNRLGADPVAALTHRTGDWALRLLLLSLAMTPLRRLFGVVAALRYRRMLGLWAFAYASMHLAIYLAVDLGGYWAQIWTDIAKRPFITVGFAAWVLLIPLAATSTRRAMRALGRNWARLHRLVYAIGVLACLHFVWVVKSGKAIARVEPVVYAVILAILLLARLPWRRWFARASGDTTPMRGADGGPPPVS